MMTKKLAAALAVVFAGAGLAGCAGVATSSYAYNDSYVPNQPNKAQGCYDASVVLVKSMAQSKEIAKKALVAVDSSISKETDSALEAQRNRHIGVFVGSGGEELFVSLRGVGNDKTFVTVTTKTGFVGGAGQKAWSCEIVDSIVSMAGKA